MIKTKRLRTLLLMMLVLLCAEGRTVRDFFASEPGEVFGLLPRTVRLDMVDYYDNGTVVAANNNMGGTTQIDTLTDNFLRVHTSQALTVELRMMQWKRDTILAVIETVATPVADSRITFYNKHWYRLSEIKPFRMPTLDDFIVPGASKAQRRQVLEGIKFALIELRFGGDNFEQLTARHGLAEFLSKEEWEPLRPLLRPTLTYRIVGGKIK